MGNPDIANKYNKLLEKKMTLDLIPDFLFLQEECLKERNFLYYYECFIVIIDIYINEVKLDDALEIALDLFSKPNIKDFNDPYKSLLDRLVYIYITKQYYQRALNICLMKKDVLDIENQDEINRWYLELAYIHEAIGEKNEALMKLTSILESNPSPDIEAVVLNNITKLFIDANNIVEGKEYLNKCIDLVTRINDEEGIRYCKYLKAKIYRLDKQYKEAKKIFISLFKDVSELEIENFNYLNEYLILLCEMEEYTNAYEICAKFFTKVNSSQDLQNKLLFYKTCLKIDIALNTTKKKKTFVESPDLLDKIGKLEEEIILNKDIKTTEIKEEELSFQLKNSEKNISAKVSQTLLSISYQNSDNNIRSLIINYFSTLQNKIPFDEAVLLILDKEKKQVIPSLPVDQSIINTYSFKNNRLYERNIGYEKLLSTPVEILLSGRSDYLVTINNLNTPLYCPITSKDYRDTTNKYLYAVSLASNNTIYGVIIFLSQIHNLTNDFSKMILAISSKMFSPNLVNAFENESLELQTNLLNTSIANNTSGIFYELSATNKMILSSVIKNLLGINKDEITITDYLEYIALSDKEKYLIKTEAKKANKPYEIDYHLNVSDSTYLIHEQASPVCSLNESNDVSKAVYCGTINKVTISETIVKEVNNERLLTIEDLRKEIEKYKSKSFTGYVINPFRKRISYSKKDKCIEEVYHFIKQVFQTTIYYHNNLFYILDSQCSDKDALKKLNNVISLLKNYQVSYTFITYPLPLIRLDDFIDLSIYLLNDYTSDNYCIFNNEVYAQYISKATINSILSKALINNSIEVDIHDIYVDGQQLGYKAIPNVKGIYNENNLHLASNKILRELDKWLITKQKQENYVSLIDITLDSLYYMISNKLIDDNSRFIFNLSKNKEDIDDFDEFNQVISYLSKTKCKVMIDNYLLHNLSLFNIALENRNINNRVIIGFNETIDNEYLKVLNPRNERFYHFGEDSLLIKK